MSACARSICAGEKAFIDYAGQTVPIYNPETGKVDLEAQVFIATLGASNYSYAEATASQTLPDWIKSHIRALEFFGGVPQILVPDNLKSGVTHPCRYEPDVNPTYLDLARHYGITVIPARPGKPKDKAKVESRRADRRTLDTGGIEEPSLLLIGRAEPGDC
jgi:transposase